MRRAKADLDKMQTPRKKAQPAPALQVEVLQDESKSAPVPEAEKPAPTIRTQSQPSKPAQQARPNLCPCNSGREFIECCAATDGPASQKAAYRHRLRDSWCWKASPQPQPRQNCVPTRYSLLKRR
jgi:hypothetical protein